MTFTPRLTEWLSGLTFKNEQKKYLWARYSLSPITPSGFDQAPSQR